VSRWRTVPTVRIIVQQQGKGATAWAVLVNDEVLVSGLTEQQANRKRRSLEFFATPKARAAARERITGG